MKTSTVQVTSDIIAMLKYLQKISFLRGKGRLSFKFIILEALQPLVEENEKYMSKVYELQDSMRKGRTIG